MKKTVLVSFWDATKGNTSEKTVFYQGITREKALLCFVKQYFENDFNTLDYPETLDGIYKSNVIKDRILYDYTENIIVYAQFA